MWLMPVMLFLVTICGAQDSRSFTNGHGGYQFFHAQLQQEDDQNLAESNAFNYITTSTAKHQSKEEAKSITTATTATTTKTTTSEVPKVVLMKRRLFTGTTARPKILKTRQRIVVRKYNTKKSNEDKNRKREIKSTVKFKLANRHFKPTPKSKISKSDVKSLFGARKPFMHLKRQNVTVSVPVSTTTLSPLSKSMKEKRHLANIRFFNRRKMRS